MAKLTYCCPYCNLETEDPKLFLEHLEKFHNYPANPPPIKRYVLIRIEYP